MPALSPVSKINLDNYRFVRTIETGGFGEWAAFALSDVVWTILFAWIASSDRALVRPATVYLMTCHARALQALLLSTKPMETRKMFA